MRFLGPYDDFPPVETATKDGILAVGGDLSTQRLIRAYNNGIFPWYDSSEPIIWWSPNPRMVLFPEKLKVSKSMKQLLKKDAFTVSFNKEFGEVIKNCAAINRRGQDSTWITDELRQAFLQLHKLGIAISVEVWNGDDLVGGLYGIYLEAKKVFCGESMFSRESNASKYGFIKLVENLQTKGVKLIDCQVYTDHLASLGAEEISREEFLAFLR